MSVPFNIGARVRCRNQLWEVLKLADNGDGSWTVRLYPEPDGKPQSFLFPLTPIERVTWALDNLAAGRIDHLDHYRLLTSATRLSLVYEYDKLLSISNSRMVPEPYQLLAVKKVMESLRQRFLIADDVGLGKTIEAGLIMQELAARQRGTRVLIVCPASLQDQWQKEMRRHFNRSFALYNSRRMSGIRELVDENLNPWLARNSIITSIDWVKPQYEGAGAARKNTNRILDQLLKVERRWDLVIIDEAHYVSTDANRADFAREIQDRSDALLLLTATPHSGNPEHFFNLLNLVDPFMFASPADLDRADARDRVDKVMIRRGKETVYELNEEGTLVKKFRDRDPHSVEIKFTDDEQALYDAVTEYTAGGWSRVARNRSLSAAERNVEKFLLALVQKHMVSSLAALRETLDRRIDSIVESRTAGKLGLTDGREIARLWKSYSREEDLDDDDRELVERYLETRKLQAVYADRTNEVKTLRALLELADELIARGQDSKLEWLKEFLKRLFTATSEKVIVFTEYRDTLSYIRKSLAKEWWVPPGSIVVIHGGMPLGETDAEPGSKLEAERLFHAPECRMLLATDAASEGLNLQRKCHIMVNYELPWNPNRLEQRIGRIHRYGQKHVARIHNLMIEGSKEAQIFKRLQEKIETIRRQLGSMADVLGVLERVSLDDLILKVLDRSVNAAEAEQIADRELKRLDEAAKSLQKTQFLSGCRQFTRADIDAAEHAIARAQEAIPDHRDVRSFVETFLHVYGDNGSGERNGRCLHPARTGGVFRLHVPSVLQDEKLPRVYPRVTFERTVATRDWSDQEQPDFLAFGHPLLERMVYYCRVTRAADLGGKLTCLTADYPGLPGAVFNFLLRFEDRNGRMIREELEPVFVDIEGAVVPELGRRLYLAPAVPGASPARETTAKVSERIDKLKAGAEAFIRARYQEYYSRVEQRRSTEIALVLEDLDRFDRGITADLEARQAALGGVQPALSGLEDPNLRAQRTRYDNQLRAHTHRMRERRTAVESMRIGAFPAPELLNLVVVTPA